MPSMNAAIKNCNSRISVETLRVIKASFDMLAVEPRLEDRRAVTSCGEKGVSMPAERNMRVNPVDWEPAGGEEDTAPGLGDEGEKGAHLRNKYIIPDSFTFDGQGSSAPLASHS